MSQTKIGRDISQEILAAIEQLQLGSGFGSIEIVLHEGRVTQIEKREKVRFINSSVGSPFPNANTPAEHTL